MSAEVRDKVIEIMAQVMNVKASDLDGNSSPDTIEDWDSLKHMSLVLALENQFDMQFSEDQITAEMLSVQQIVDVISANQK
jgi:acyl carrier protein